MAHQPRIERLTFKVNHMDCAAEEQLVRMKLADYDAVKQLIFDLPQRTLIVTHTGDSSTIEQLVHALNLDSSVTQRETVDALDTDEDSADDAQQRKLLMIVLAINFSLFLVEMITGFLANSMGLVADSLDMLADAIVYGLSLYAVGRAVTQKKQIARMSGYFQVFLAVFGILEVLRRFFGFGDEPTFSLMIVISLLALAGNAASLMILHRARSKEVHMQASWIFTSNDVIVNISVIIAGVLVSVTRSNLPDLVVGAAVFCLVGYGAFRILNLSK